MNVVGAVTETVNDKENVNNHSAEFMRKSFRRWKSTGLLSHRTYRTVTPGFGSIFFKGKLDIR